MLVLARFSHPKSPLHLFSRGSELLPDSRRRFESDHLELSGAGWLTLTYYNIGGVWSGLWRAERREGWVVLVMGPNSILLIRLMVSQARPGQAVLKSANQLRERGQTRAGQTNL